MTLKMRENINEARKRARQVVSVMFDEESQDTIYNLIVKAYLRGYYEALEQTQEELQKDLKSA